MKTKVMFISSTGGHLSELLQLEPLFKKYDNTIVTEAPHLAPNLYNKCDRVFFLKYGTRKNLLPYLFIYLYNIFLSLFIYLKTKPSVIITTGTHTAVSMCFIGKLFGTKIIYIETFANITTKTLTGRIIYPIADVFIVQWESMLKLYPKAVYGGWIY